MALAHHRGANRVAGPAALLLRLCFGLVVLQTRAASLSVAAPPAAGEQSLEGRLPDPGVDASEAAGDDGEGAEESQRRPRSLPKAGRVVVLLRGQSFRSKGYACHDEANQSQWGATASLVKQVIRPLEENSNQVDVIVTDQPCHLNRTLLDVLGSNVALSVWNASGSQAGNVRWALNVLKDHAGGGAWGVANKYNLVVVARHDIYWKEPISEWSTDFKKFNFASRCEPQATWTEGPCVSDLFYVMPGRLFPALDKEVGRGRCFTGLWNRFRFLPSNQDGHECYNQMVGAVSKLGGSVGFATHWRPIFTVRNESTTFNLY